MESKELRVGNLVYESKRSKILRKKIGVEICEIKSLNIHHLESFPESENFEPIPLTEEWLLKFKFIKDDNEFRAPKILGFIKSIYEICIRLHDGFCDVVLEEEQINIEIYTVILPLKIKYVHQLQNLYFALTGKELTNIK
jgi:hypothetical protein